MRLTKMRKALKYKVDIMKNPFRDTIGNAWKCAVN